MTNQTHGRSLTGVLVSSFLLASALVVGAQSGSAPATPSVRPLVSQGSMNVYRRFAPEHREKMLEYYGKVLELRALQPITFGGGAQMILFGVGSGQIKLATGLKQGRQYAVGGVKDGTGIRVISLFVTDAAAVTARFAAHGYPAPQFRAGDHGTRVAVVADPGGFMTELVVVPNGPAGTADRMEVGIGVSDLETSRAFYRDFVGLDELPAVQDPVLGVTKYPYRHGETTINLWAVGKGLPADTGSAGIQYVVSDVDTVDARAKARSVAVEEPLSNLGGFSLRTVWLNDPDGVTNYFAQVGVGGGGGAGGGRGRGNAPR
jgi:catechol 2,3-dioxygenase-like lactoylglutathione lyase family enzyme